MGIEKQVALPRQKGAGKTMQNYGIFLGYLEAYQLRYTEIRAQDWQRYLKIPAGLEYKERKRLIASKITEIYPHCETSFYGPKGGLLDGRTDALAIAHYTTMVLL